MSTIVRLKREFQSNFLLVRGLVESQMYLQARLKARRASYVPFALSLPIISAIIFVTTLKEKFNVKIYFADKKSSQRSSQFSEWKIDQTFARGRSRRN